MSSMDKKIKEILSAVLNVPENILNENSSPKTVANWDSLNHMKIVLSLEEEFKVQLSDQDIIDLQSFKLIKLILSKNLEG